MAHVLKQCYRSSLRVIQTLVIVYTCLRVERLSSLSYVIMSPRRGNLKVYIDSQSVWLSYSQCKLHTMYNNFQWTLSLDHKDRCLHKQFYHSYVKWRETLYIVMYYESARRNSHYYHSKQLWITYVLYLKYLILPLVR